MSMSSPRSVRRESPSRYPACPSVAACDIAMLPNLGTSAHRQAKEREDRAAHEKYMRNAHEKYMRKWLAIAPSDVLTSPSPSYGRHLLQRRVRVPRPSQAIGESPTRRHLQRHLEHLAVVDRHNPNSPQRDDRLLTPEGRGFNPAPATKGNPCTKPKRHLRTERPFALSDSVSIVCQSSSGGNGEREVE